MQFLWKYVDDMVGKGLEWYLILELLFYASATFVSMAFPLAVLLSSLMTFGNMGEKYEIVAMKSAGISVMSLMRPLAFIALLIGLFSFWFSNNILPIANVKFKTLLFEIRQQKPALTITEGVFYDGFGDYTIRVGKKDVDNETIEDIIIYNQDRYYGNTTVTYAKNGTMSITPDKRYFIFILNDGFYWDEQQRQNVNSADYPLFYMKFTTQYMRMDLSSFGTQKVDESLFKSSVQSMTLHELKCQIDTLVQERQRKLEELAIAANAVSWYYVNFVKKDSTFLMRKEPATASLSLSSFSPDMQEKIFNHAYQNIGYINNRITDAYEMCNLDEESIYEYAIEFHRKFSLSVACFLFFFIGAPLGTIIRKGGIAVPLVITVLFFTIYFVISIIGEKMAQSAEVEVWFGMWMSTMILIPIGIFLTYKATMDSAIMSPDTYIHALKRFLNYFRKK